jgi:monolysocardiolipin acyltransferase
MSWIRRGIGGTALTVVVVSPAAVVAYQRRHYATFDPAAQFPGESNVAALRADSKFMTLVRSITIGSTMTFSRMVMQVLNETHIDNIEVFHRQYDAVDERPLLTVSNHSSIADDPFIVGLFLPQKYDWDSSKHRWSMCKEDICYKNRALASYFSTGKTLPIRQGAGITQNALRIFAEKLKPGGWCHIFPEGHTWQCGRVGGDDRWNDWRPYMRWGVGKVIATAKVPPVVLPVYHTGMEEMFPQEGQLRKVVFSEGKMTGRKIRVRFGTPIEFTDLLEEYWHDVAHAQGDSSNPNLHPNLHPNPNPKKNVQGDSTGDGGHSQLTGVLEEWGRPPTDAEARLYSAIADRVQQALAQLEDEVLADGDQRPWGLWARGSDWLAARSTGAENPEAVEGGKQ